jgi:tryptophan-rich sensory protein
MKLNVKAFGKALGLVWGLILAVMAWSACLGWQMGSVEVVKSSYVGMEASFIGGLIAFVWGFISGFLTGAGLAYFYNRLVGKK